MVSDLECFGLQLLDLGSFTKSYQARRLAAFRLFRRFFSPPRGLRGLGRAGIEDFKPYA